MHSLRIVILVPGLTLVVKRGMAKLCIIFLLFLIVRLVVPRLLIVKIKASLYIFFIRRAYYVKDYQITLVNRRGSLGGKGLRDSILVYSILLGVITCGSLLYLVNMFFFLNMFLYLGKKPNLAIKVTLYWLVKLIYNYYICL